MQTSNATGSLIHFFMHIIIKTLMNLPLIISKQSMRSNELSDWFHGKMERLNIAATYNLVHNATYLVQLHFPQSCEEERKRW